jgi:hypothetical protein
MTTNTTETDHYEAEAVQADPRPRTHHTVGRGQRQANGL